MISLVGYTGFVGSNIYAVGRDMIEGLYNSENIEDAYGTSPDVLIYAGMRAEKYLANKVPEADMGLVRQAEENIHRIAPQKLVLISTIDVFKDPNGKDEGAEIDTQGLHPYGLNRYRLEQWVRENIPDALIIRLPGLYGANIKKNFLYDYINVIPSMLKETKFAELAAKDPQLWNYYELQRNGFYKCMAFSEEEKRTVREKFRKVGFTAIQFTDSRNVYQFYPLSRLWSDIRIALKSKLTLWHPATEPVSASEVYRFLTGRDFVNNLSGQPVYYDYRTKYADLFEGNGDYLMSKEAVLEDIRQFVGSFS